MYFTEFGHKNYKFINPHPANQSINQEVVHAANARFGRPFAPLKCDDRLNGTIASTNPAPPPPHLSHGFRVCCAAGRGAEGDGGAAACSVPRPLVLILHLHLYSAVPQRIQRGSQDLGVTVEIELLLDQQTEF